MSGTIERFAPEHLFEADWTGEPMARAVGCDLGLEEVGQKYAENGIGLTARYKGKVIACMGVVKLWGGVGEVWCFTAQDAQAHPRLLCRAALWGIDAGMKTLGLHRVQAHVDADFEAGLRWARYLRLEFEGPCSKYTADGRDVVRFARVK